MKVLIISHNPVGTANNMGKTFLSLFSGFAREELCQLYIYPTLPDSDCCGAYYRITDKDVLRSLACFRQPGGPVAPEKISRSNALFENPADEGFYRSRKNKKPLRRLLRDAMWAMSRWHGSGLKQWLDREKPACIFVAPGTAGFLYDMAMEIAEARQIPIVTYICDDYYFTKVPGGLLGRFQHCRLRARIEKLIGSSDRLVVICPELAEAYTARFGIPASVVMTGTAYPVARAPRVRDEPRVISYFGNIRCGRNRSLAEIGRELDRINREENTHRVLRIYTAEKDGQILSVLEGIASVELPGYISGVEFEQALRDAELLLHTEGFAPEDVDRVRHSLSTKIADSLASGVPLLAYGPAEVASMGHLLRNRCAVTAVTREQLAPMLQTAFTDGAACRRAAEQGLATAREFHEPGKAAGCLRQVLTQSGT